MLKANSSLSSSGSKPLSVTEIYNRSRLEDNMQRGQNQAETKLRALNEVMDGLYRMFVVHQGNKQVQPIFNLVKTARVLVVELGELITTTNDAALNEELNQAKNLLMKALNDAAKKDSTIEDQAQEIERLKKLLEPPAPPAE